MLLVGGELARAYLQNGFEVDIWKPCKVPPTDLPRDLSMVLSGRDGIISRYQHQSRRNAHRWLGISLCRTD